MELTTSDRMTPLAVYEPRQRQKVRRPRDELPIPQQRRSKRCRGNDDEDDDDEDDDDENKPPSALDKLLKSGFNNILSRDSDHSKGKFNHIYFDDAVTKYSSRKLIGKLDELNIKLGKLSCDYELLEAPKIYLHINSFGGSILAAFTIIDAMRQSKFPIVTIIEGGSASAATLISVFGHERWMTKHGYMLIHQLSSMCWGKMEEIDDEHENLKQWMEHIYKIYEDKTKMKRSELVKLLRHDKWWNAETCLQKGLIDKII
jgi:ATP-dependent Clp protease protease subunit